MAGLESYSFTCSEIKTTKCFCSKVHDCCSLCSTEIVEKWDVVLNEHAVRVSDTALLPCTCPAQSRSRTDEASAIRNAVSSLLAGLAVQIVQKAWYALTKSCSLEPLRFVIQPCTRFNPAVIQFQILSQSVNGSVSIKQAKTLSESGTPLLVLDRVGVIVTEPSPKIDQVIRFLFYSMSKKLSEYVPINSL